MVHENLQDGMRRTRFLIAHSRFMITVWTYLTVQTSGRGSDGEL
jgi:hypothetical protein